MYPLFAFTAGLVRRLHINRLYKLSESIWRIFTSSHTAIFINKPLLRLRQQLISRFHFTEYISYQCIGQHFFDKISYISIIKIK